MTGVVLSDKMDKTIVVRVGRIVVHPIFKKAVRKFNKFKAHDEKNQAKTGDTVRIKEMRPTSREKRWGLVEIMKKAEG
ncbi:MAG: 30S ribosomal protein S17 [Candidatus Omnitrophica bacterium]|nr:30S ribosomal protein S17 [Candidatus Omnitrophota bacterium]